MKKIITVFAIFLCLTVATSSCTRLKKTVPSEDKAASQSQGVKQESNGDKNNNSTNAANPAQSPAAALKSSASPEKKSQQTALNMGSKYVVLVDKSEQKVYVYKNGTIIRAMICSTGLPGKDTETPAGNFKIDKYRGTFFYNSNPDVEEGAKYWVGFIGANFLFHSVPTDKNGNIIQTEAKKLGTPASHGCVRMSMADAKWFYETIPTGSNVVIQD